MGWFRRLSRTVLGSSAEAEFDEEAAFHLDERTAELIARGWPRDTARREARRQLGSQALARERTRDADTFRWLLDTAVDIRRAVRSLRSTPTFSAAVVLTFALGIGANAAMFSVVYGVLLRPLPYRDPARLVLIQTRDRLTGRVAIGGFSGPDLADWTERTAAFESLALVSRDVFALETERGYEAIDGATVSGGFFATIDTTLVRGTPLSEDRADEIVISERLWRRSFSQDPATIGRRVRLNSKPYTIVGIAPADVEVPTVPQTTLGSAATPPELWTRIEPGPRETDRRLRYFHLIGRLTPSTTLAEARADAERTAQMVASDAGPTEPRMDPVVTGLGEALTSRGRAGVLLMFGATTFVLLIACANIANLLLARQASRERELAVRRSLGASPARLLTQVLAESWVLALLGAAGGLVLAHGVIHAARSFGPTVLPRLAAVRMDLPALSFVLASTVACALMVAMVPGVRILMSDRPLATRPVGRAARGGAFQRRARSTLVVSQVALSVMLLVGALLLARSLMNLLRADVGAVIDRVVSVELNVAMGRTMPESRQVQLTDQLIAEVHKLPGVRDVAVANGLPPNRTRMAQEFEFPDVRDGTPRRRRLGLVNPTPEYFNTLGIPLLRGRLFTASDGPAAPRVVIVSAGAARLLFGTVDVVGRSVPIGPERAPVLIVGVVGDVKYGGLDAAAGETLYLPFAQRPFRNFTLVARTREAAGQLTSDIERIIHGVDREIMRGPVRTLEEVVLEAVAQPRFRMALFATLAGLALLLAAIGLYGVVAFGVEQRTAEIGIRVALGATDRGVMRLVLWDALAVTLVGAGLGALGAYVGSRALAGLLYEVRPTDGSSFVLAVASLVAVAGIASYFPARRATRLDPLSAIRSE